MNLLINAFPMRSAAWPTLGLGPSPVVTTCRDSSSFAFTTHKSSIALSLTRPPKTYISTSLPACIFDAWPYRGKGLLLLIFRDDHGYCGVPFWDDGTTVDLSDAGEVIAGSLFLNSFIAFACCSINVYILFTLFLKYTRLLYQMSSIRLNHPPNLINLLRLSIPGSLVQSLVEELRIRRDI